MRLGCRASPGWPCTGLGLGLGDRRADDAEPVAGAEFEPARDVCIRHARIGQAPFGGRDSDLEGIARGDAESWRQLGDATIVESDDGGAHIRLALTDGVIAGGIVMGDQSASFALQELIGARADISSIAARLQEPGAPVGEILHSFWEDWRRRGA